MSFPQTSAVDQTRRGQDYWRLFTQIASSGDIYESEVGARGFVIGAQSDIARASVTYRDPNLADEVATQEISVEKPFVGRVDASTQNYPTGQRARALITLRDVLPPPGYVPAAASGTPFVSTTFPNIDLLQYLGDVPSFLPMRADSVFRSSSIFELAVGGEFWRLYPFYGRRNFYLTCTNLNAVTTITVSIFGINFSHINTAVAPVLAPQHQEVLLSGPTVIAAAGGILAVPLNNLGFDYIAVLYDPSASSAEESVPRTVILSDRIT